jgi:hypothetical protein
MLARLLKQTNLLSRLRTAWRHDAEETMKPARKELRRLAREVEQLRALLEETSVRAVRGDRNAAQLRVIAELNEEQRQQLAMLPTVLDKEELAASIDRAIAAATMRSDPFHHVVLEQLLPPRVYDLLLEAMPPTVFFSDHDPVKQDLPLPLTFAPLLAIAVWNFVDDTLARQLIQPAVLHKFHEPLQQHYEAVFGAAFVDRANQLPQLPSGGRLMLRRPGYHLEPHRDPKRSLLTCLMYLARPGDIEAYGTQLFRVAEDNDAPFKQTYYPRDHGHQCELVSVVPFRPNTMLVFLNSRGAHGATIPDDAPREMQRYAYQFYVAPENAALGALIRELPAERRVLWQNRNKLADSS